MAELRPVRLYTHTFVHPTAPNQQVTRSGRTPCAAKNAAFAGMEALLAASQTTEVPLPLTGWRLLQQEDVTHLVRVR